MPRRVRRRLALLIAALGLATPTPALAAHSVVPPPGGPTPVCATACQAKACRSHAACRARVEARDRHARFLRERHARYLAHKARAHRRHLRFLAEKHAVAERRHERLLRHGCTQSMAGVPACLNYAIRVYHLGPIGVRWMYRVSRCESGWRWNAINLTDSNARAGHPSVGLFQFIPGTFGGTPYRGHWIYSNFYQSLAAAWMYARGASGAWSCK